MSNLRAFVLLSLSSPSLAQWNPPAAQWGKVDPADLRVMSWNVQDAVCSTNSKVEGNNNWCACARVVAALKPDVLLMTETADNSGNGTGSSIDSVNALSATIGNFLHGGNDSFHGNSLVTSYVQKYAPGYDLPYVFVSSSNDGFNRNVVFSRYPFADLNGDTKSTLSDIPSVTATAWAPGGNGGIRGFLFTEIDLPDPTYAGNLVLGGAHLKAGSNSTDHTQRITAAENVAYVVRYWWNGNGGGTPDPAGRIADSPAATSVLAPDTPVVLLGDWNEDELQNGSTRGPVDWLSQAQTVGGASDGTDADGTDMIYDASVNYFSGLRETHNSGSKLDYIAWQDSIASLRLSSVFVSGANPSNAQPSELIGFAGGVANVSTTASDHRPVIADLRLPVADCNGNGVADTSDIANGTSQDSNGDQIPDECQCTTPAAYCTGKVNSQLCSPSIAYAGTPSATHPAPFDIQGVAFLNNKSGLMFYGFGPGSTPFEGGLFCVQAPVKRTPVQNSGGSPSGNDCTGIYSFDFNAYIRGGLDPNLLAGVAVYAQYWARDPQDPFTTSLSNALGFTICN
jgi:endonuclease/exonuclease/phosphatase family metal-dependent hydrolase